MTTMLQPPTRPPSGDGADRAADAAVAGRTASRNRRRHAGRRATQIPTRRNGSPAARSHWRRPAAWAIVIVTVTVGLWLLAGGAGALLAGGIDTALAISQLSGLLAALAALGGLVLTARPAWLERSVGLDRMIGWHRITGMTAAFGMAVHVAASLYAAGGGVTRMWTGLIDLITTADWFVAALVAALLFALVSLTSWRRLRARMTYETWHMVHLAGYLAVALAFPHALFGGTTLGSSDVARWWWIALYAATVAVILASRVGGIVRPALRPRTTITRIIPEGPGVASLVITGPGVDAFAARPGQFVGLRVLTRDLWWQSHPYSLSAATQPGALRLTIKALGDASTRTIAVKPGTRVLLEGPYGVMTIDQAAGRRVLLVGAGVGLAPMRSLLEASTSAQAPIILARAHTKADLPLAGELDQLARERGGAMIPITGSRSQFPDGNPFTAAALSANISDLRSRAVFVCGPTALQKRVCRELERAGVPRDQIHYERFSW